MKFSGADTKIDNNEHLLSIDKLKKTPTYYTSREIKNYADYRIEIDKAEIKQNGTKNRNKAISDTRIMGALFSVGGNYAVYNFGKYIRGTSLTGERKISREIEGILIGKSHSSHVEGLVLVKDLSVLLPALKDNKLMTNLGNIISAFETCYVLPYTQEGRMHLEIMQKADWKENLKIFFTRDGWNLADQGWYDISKNDHFVNYFIIPDIQKLINFVWTSKKGYGKYTVACLEYQKPFVEDVLNAFSSGNCDIKVTSFEKIRTRFKKANK